MPTPLKILALLFVASSAAAQSRFEAPPPPPAIEDQTDLILQIDDLIGITGEFIRVRPRTNGRAVAYVAKDKGLAVMPNTEFRRPIDCYILGTRPGIFRLAAVTSRNDEFSDPVEFRVIISDPAPQEKPPQLKLPPADDSGPPPMPAGRYGLAQYVREIVLTRIPNRGQRAYCVPLADNWFRTAAQIRRGVSTSIDDASYRLRLGNTAIIATADHPQWKPVFNAIDRKTDELAIQNLRDWQEAITEIGRGFRAAGTNP
jgi:hypothetical protein